MLRLLSRRTFATRGFKPAVNAEKNLEKRYPSPPLRPNAPSRPRPREGPRALTMGFGGKSAAPAVKVFGFQKEEKEQQKGKFEDDSFDSSEWDIFETDRRNEQITLQQSVQNMMTRIVHVGRVSRMTKMGRRSQFRALVICGNGDGVGGFGVGKGLTSRKAVASAIREGHKDLVYLDISPWGSLYQDVSGKCNSTRVTFKAIQPHRMHRTQGRLTRSIMEMFGVQKYSAFITGRNNPFSIVNAAFHALSKHETPKQVASRRGRKLIDMTNPELFDRETMF